MREDLKLMKVSMFLGIFSLIVLIVFSVCIYRNLCYCLPFEIASRVIVSMFSGIFGGCATLFLTKLFDYKQKRKDRLIEYFGLILMFHEYTRGIKPLIRGKTKEKDKNSYKKYYEHADLFYKVRQSYINLYFSSSKKDYFYKQTVDEMYKLVRSTYQNLNRVCLLLFGSDVHIGSVALKENYLRTCMNDLFKSIFSRDFILYKNKFSQKLAKLLNKLYSSLFNTKKKFVLEETSFFRLEKIHKGDFN